MLGFADRIRQLEARREKVVDLSLGQPEVPSPNHIAQALQRSLDKPITAYTSSAGSEQLRQLIAERISRESGVETRPSEVMVTHGSKHALFVSLMSLVDPGDEVLVPEPYFPPYAEIVGLAGGKLKTVPISGTGNKIELDVEALLGALTPKTKVIIINYPNNPAGWTLEKNDVNRIVDHCSENGVYLVSDEAYEKIVFDDRTHCPAWSFSEGTDFVIGVGSFSKTYSMVPYRLGFLTVRSQAWDGILKVQRATVTMVSPYIQSAGCAALSGPQDFVSSRLAKYEERRDKCIALLRSKGIPVPTPEGAFYLFAKLPDAVDAFKFATDLLERQHVAVLPGAIFGERWRNNVRISFATDDDVLYEGIERFAEAHRGLS